jgi:hypothetical protein
MLNNREGDKVDPATMMLIAQGVSQLMRMLQQTTQTPGGIKQFDTMTPGQKQSSDFSRMFGQNQLQNPYSGFDAIQNNALNNFYGQGTNSLAERFSGSGSNAISSPDFGRQWVGARNDLLSNLAAQQSQYGQQNQMTGLKALQLGQQPQFENYYQQPQNNWLSSLFGHQAGMLGTIGGGIGQGTFGNIQ